MKKIIWAAAGLLLIILMSCGNGGASEAMPSGGDTLTRYSEMLTMTDFGAWKAVEIRAPWSDSLPIGRYALVEKGEAVQIPEGFTRIEVPMTRTVVFSAVYTSAIDELGRLDAVKGVADGDYYMIGDTVVDLIRHGAIVDIGSSMAPLIEKVAEIEPDGILLSPYEGGGLTGLERLRVPMVWMADYLETSPLARAEWMLLIGELYGESQKARTIFDNVERRYIALSERVKNEEDRPTVVFEKPLSGVWYVPGGASYVAKLAEDAGASYPWSDDVRSGSIALDEAAVIDRAENADIWLFKDISDYDRSKLLVELPHSRALRPFPENVYFCNTVTSSYYNKIAFHPEAVLEDMIAVFHPGAVEEGYKLRFFQKMK